MVGPPKFRKRTPIPLLLLFSEVVAGDTPVDGVVDGSDIALAARNSVLRFSLLLEGDGDVANRRVHDDEDDEDAVLVAASCFHPLQSILLLSLLLSCVLEVWDKTCRLALGIKAVVDIFATDASDTSATRTLLVLIILIAKAL